jgi:hypothetical protein
MQMINNHFYVLESHIDYLKVAVVLIPLSV